MGQVTIFKNIQSDSQNQFFEINEVLNRIKRGNNRNLIQKIRNEKNNEKRDSLKKQLFWICFSGKFSARKNNSMIEHSGFICLDFDKIPDNELAMWRNKIKRNPHTYALFTSPSGNGLKVIWKIPPCKTNDEHNLRFEAIYNEFLGCKYFDKNVKGWSRVCFESYDPEIYVNENSVVFEKISEKKPIVPAKVRANDDVEKDAVFLVNKISEQQVDITDNYEDWLNIGFGIADKFGESGRELFHKISSVSSKYEYKQCDRQYSACLRGNRSGISINTLFHLAKQADIYIIDAEPEPNTIDYLTIDDGEDSEDIEIDEKKWYFWDITPRGSLKINYFQLGEFLVSNGYFKHRFNPDDISFIKIEQNIVEVVTPDNIRDFILTYLRKVDEEQAYNLFADSTKMKKEYLSLLPEKKPAFVSDTNNESWVFFKNIAVKITADSLEEIPYIDLNGYIWKSQIIDRVFYIEPEFDCDFYNFMMNLSGGSSERFKSLASGIGYMMHRFKNPSNVKSLILTEEELTEKPEGGTGKGLIFQAIGKFRVVVSIDGKAFNSGKSFVWQRVEPDTDIVLIDDIPKKFVFENLFSILTTGWPIEKKNKGEIFLSPEESPKIGIATNYVIKGDNSAIRRRKFEIEIYKHYSDNFQPIDDFGRNFFTEWDEKEYNLFDNLMLKCVSLYLKNGLIEVDFVNLKIKRLIAQTSNEFVQFAQQNFNDNTRYSRNAEYKKFIEENPGSYCKSASMFYQWMCDYAIYMGWKHKDSGKGGMFIEFGEVTEPINDNKNELPF